MGLLARSALALLLCATLILACTACSAPVPAPARAEKTASVRFLLDRTEADFHDPQVLSIDNENKQFEVTLLSHVLSDPTQAHTSELTLGELHLPVCSWGRSGEVSDFTFRATAEQARAIARALGIEARDRGPFYGELVGKLEAVGELRSGAEHLPLRFTLANTGPLAVWFLDGGRGRNELGRDNRFRFEVTRDVGDVPVRELVDFGGLASYRRLEPGESHTLELDLAHWCKLADPGRYFVHATYEAELLPAEFEPDKPMPMGWHAHIVQTRRIAAELELDLR